MSFWKKYRKLHIWLAVDLAVLGLYLALRQNQQLMNSFADHVTTPLKAALGRLCALTSLSVMEILYALAAVVAVAYTVHMLNPRYEEIAKAYGIPYEVVIDRKDLKAKVEKMISTKGPYLLECGQ